MLQQKIRRSTVDVLFLRATRRVNVVTRCRISAFLFLFSVGFLDQYLHLLVCPLSPTSARNIISGLLWDDPGSVFSTVVVSDYKKKYLLIHITVLFFTCSLSLNTDKGWSLVIVISVVFMLFIAEPLDIFVNSSSVLLSLAI